MTLSSFVIPAEDILSIEVRGPFSIGDIFGGKVKLRWWVLKLDWSDFFQHVEIHRRSGLFKYLRFTPDNPQNFVATCESLLRSSLDRRAPKR